MIGCKWVVLRSGARCATILRAMARSDIRDRMQQAGQRRMPRRALWDCKPIVLCHCKPLMLCFPAKRTQYVRFPTSESECHLVREHRDHEAICHASGHAFPRHWLSRSLNERCLLCYSSLAMRESSHLPGMFLGCTFPAITIYSSEMELSCAFAMRSPCVCNGLAVTICNHVTNYNLLRW